MISFDYRRAEAPHVKNHPTERNIIAAIHCGVGHRRAGRGARAHGFSNIHALVRMDVDALAIKSTVEKGRSIGADSVL